MSQSRHNSSITMDKKVMSLYSVQEELEANSGHIKISSEKMTPELKSALMKKGILISYNQAHLNYSIYR